MIGASAGLFLLTLQKDAEYLRLVRASVRTTKFRPHQAIQTILLKASHLGIGPSFALYRAGIEKAA